MLAITSSVKIHLQLTNVVNTHVTLNWVFTFHENDALINFLCKMAAACICSVNHVHCCSCLFHQEQTWSKSLRNFPKCSPTTWSFHGLSKAEERMLERKAILVLLGRESYLLSDQKPTFLLGNLPLGACLAHQLHTLEGRTVLQGEFAESCLTNMTTGSQPPILVKFISEFKSHHKPC